MTLFFWRKKEVATPLRVGKMIVVQEAPQRFTLTVSGVISPQLVAECQKKILAVGRQGSKSRGMIRADDFQGFVRGFDGGTSEIERALGIDEIVERIAVVANEKWHENLEIFMGGWMRKAQISFFAPTDVERARAWLES